MRPLCRQSVSQASSIDLTRLTLRSRGCQNTYNVLISTTALLLKQFIKSGGILEYLKIWSVNAVSLSWSYGCLILKLLWNKNALPRAPIIIFLNIKVYRELVTLCKYHFEFSMNTIWKVLKFTGKGKLFVIFLSRTVCFV